MIRNLLFSFISIALLYSCSDETAVPNTDIDVARAFIKNVLNNKIKEANGYILQDQENKEFYNVIERKYKAMSKDELENYKNADIIINEISNVSDSVTVINYSTTVKKDASTKVKMVKINDRWLVDLKYTFSGNL